MNFDSIKKHIYTYIDLKMCPNEFLHQFRDEALNTRSNVLIKEGSGWWYNPKYPGCWDGFVQNKKIIYTNIDNAIDSICYLIHEYGHHLSLENGDKRIITECKYDYDKQDESGEDCKDKNPRYILLLEELNAWKYAIVTLQEIFNDSSFDINDKQKNKLTFNFGYLMIKCLSSYVFELLMCDKN